MASPPPAARAVGYRTRTFSTARFSAANVDLSKRLDTGKQWYLWNLFGCDTPASQVVLARDGTADVYGECGPSGALMSAMAKPGAPGTWVGTMFGGGGYFEAEIAYDVGAIDLKRGWPAWWTMSGEHLFQMRPEVIWAGHGDRDYEHFVEVDILEALLPRAQHPDSYAASVHDWYGHYARTCPKIFCKVSTPYRGNITSGPAGTDWSRWHKIAMRWVPAAGTSKGEITFYMDDRQVGQTVRWDRYDDEPPPVPAYVSGGRGCAFSIVDRQNLVLIFGAGSTTPIRIRSVNVWQASARGNLVR